MIFNEDNLRAGLNTFTDPAKPRYGKAFENYSTKINDGMTSALALEYALAEAVKGLTNKDEKLKNARIAAGFSRRYDLRTKRSAAESSSTTTKVLPVTEGKPKNKMTLEKARALRDKSNLVFQSIIKWIAIVAVAIAIGFGISFLLEADQLGRGNVPQVWIEWLVVPFVAAFLIVAAYIIDKYRAKRKKERNEHRDPSTKDRDKRREPSRVSSTPA